ncbi:hypothetical protein BH11MYX3_BH11MYX3_16540 [soil metagenome]
MMDPTLLAHLREVERRLVGVVRQAAGLLPPDKLADIESYAVDHGEYGVAFEDLCTYVYDHEVTLPDAIAQELAELAAMMKMTLPPRIGNPGWVPPVRDN